MALNLPLDLGDGHWLEFHCWRPDRALNPHFSHLPDVEKYGATIHHKTPSGEDCQGAVTFDGPVQRELDPDGRHRWTVESWEPLTLSPSILCMACGDHGFIRNGKWERA